MQNPGTQLTVESLRSIALSVGLVLEDEDLSDILNQMRPLLHELYQWDEALLKSTEPFHVLPLPPGFEP